MDRTDVWPVFPAFADLDDEKLAEVLAELDDDDTKGASSPVQWLRTRSRLLAPPFTIAKLSQDRFVTTWSTPASSAPVNLILVRGYLAAMPDTDFRAKLVVGLEHVFEQSSERGLASRARLIEGRTRQLIPVQNAPLLSDVVMPSMGTLNMRLVYLSGQTGDAVATILKSELFSYGVSLTKAFNPVFGMATQYLAGLTQTLLFSGRNRVVAQGTFGAGDYGSSFGGALGIGTYLIAQLPNDKLARVSELAFESSTGTVRDGDDQLDANYFLLQIAPAA